MNKKEFNSTTFWKDMKCHYLNDQLKLNNDEYLIRGIDFGEGTILLVKGPNDEGFWARYENVNLIPNGEV